MIIESTSAKYVNFQKNVENRRIDMTDDLNFKICRKSRIDKFARWITDRLLQRKSNWKSSDQGSSTLRLWELENRGSQINLRTCETIRIRV